MIVCAGRNETFPFAKAIGVGLIESAINLSKLCLEEKPKELIFIGSAGSYGSHSIFDIVKSSSASNIELSFLQNNSYTPLESIIDNKDEDIVNSSNYISTNERLCKEFLKQNITLENMEFYSLISVAKYFGIKARGIFVITNFTNENAHKDFIKNHQKAKEKLIKYLEENKVISNG